MVMRASFLEHSGFLVEIGDSAALLFDWWKGELPVIGPGVPLLVFASHRHEDHFNPKIFSLDDGSRDVRFLLGKDVKLTPRNQERWGLLEKSAEKCISLGGNCQTEPLPGVKVETLTSTDEGVAFLVSTGGKSVFHAGDLNWWHWEGEDWSWNRNMEANFKRYTAPLKGRRIDLAMLPLDPRLGEAGFWGPKYFLELADISHFLPMHQWGDYSYTIRFLEKNPAFASRTVPVTKPGQIFNF